MPKKEVLVDKQIKELLGFDSKEDDAKVLKAWKAASTRVCKPCWELKYCPYGPLVEQFPLLPPTQDYMIEHQAYLKRILQKNCFDDGEPLDDDRRRYFVNEIENFNLDEYPRDIPAQISDMSCSVFGHICPVVFSAEEFTETTKMRRVGRSIPAGILMRVARRDNYICQICGASLRDNEIEFDHIIPVAKGGSSEEHNLRVTCFTCNRKKSTVIDI